MRDQWTRRASFLSGLFIALFASLAVGAADTVAALQAQDRALDSQLVLAVIWRVIGIDLLVGVPVGVWSGIVLFGVLGDRPPRELLRRMGRFFTIGSREVETERLAATGAALASAGVALGTLFLVAMPIFSRVVRSFNAALTITLAAVLSVALAISFMPALRWLLARALSLRTHILRRQIGLVSLPIATLGVAAATGAGVAYMTAHADRLFYGLELAPAWWLAGFTGALVVGLLLSFTRPVEWLLLRLSRPTAFVLSNGLLGCAMVMALQVVSEAGAHAGLLDGSGVASRVYSTISELSSRKAEDDQPAVVVEVQPEVDDTGSKAPDIIVLSVDALRADHLGLYGYQRPTSPNIDTFAARALTFDRAYSAAPCTSSSFAGMLTSRLPSRIPGANQENESFNTPEGTSSFVEHLRRSGYHTVGLVPLVPKYLSLVEKGFEEFDGYFGNSTHLTDRVIDKLTCEREDERPLFLWAHYLDVHFPYRSRPGWESFGQEPMDLYDQEIAYTDSQLARVFSQLQWLGYMEKGVVILIADHGEAFMEHGTRLHGDNLYEEQIHVPLMVAAPGLARGERFAPRVSLLDLGPTLVDLAGVEHISYHTDGHSLLARLKGLDTSNPTVLVDSCRIGTQFALVGEHKLYYRRSSGAYYLYDLLNDPMEQTNLFHRFPEVATPLVKNLRHELTKRISH